MHKRNHAENEDTNKEPGPTRRKQEAQDGVTPQLGEASLDVLHTPGHTPGSVSFALTTPARATSRPPAAQYA